MQGQTDEGDEWMAENGGAREDRRNDPLSGSDHDHLIETVSDVRNLKAEVQNLRDWRHDVVGPVMVVIQADQKAIRDQVGRFDNKLDRVLEAMGPLGTLPGDLRAHVQNDTDAFAEMRGSVAELGINVSKVFAAVGENRTARAEGESRMIKWAAGLMLTALATIILAMWGFLSPHLPWG